MQRDLRLDNVGRRYGIHGPWIPRGANLALAPRTLRQALLAGPELLVLDEAWTGLDEGARAELERAVAMGVPPRP